MEESWPDPDEALALYLRLVGKDPVAQSDFVAAFLDPLVAFLRADSPAADGHARLTAAEDAVLSVIRRPAVFDPSRGRLAAFLRMAARQDLRNLLAREHRHQKHREHQDPVEHAAAAGNSSPDGDTDLPSFDDPDVADVIAAFSEQDRRVFELMRAGERRTEVFAAALGVAHLPPDERAREAKRAKDRIIKRLRRAKEAS